MDVFNTFLKATLALLLIQGVILRGQTLCAHDHGQTGSEMDCHGAHEHGDSEPCSDSPEKKTTTTSDLIITDFCDGLVLEIESSLQVSKPTQYSSKSTRLVPGSINSHENLNGPNSELKRRPELDYKKPPDKRFLRSTILLI